MAYKFVSKKSVKSKSTSSSKSSNTSSKNFWDYEVTSQYGNGHNGIDYATPHNTPVVAPMSGTVKTAKTLKNSYGKYVVIEDKYGNTHYFSHLGSYGVKAGDSIKAGDVIGYSGSTGNSTGPHVHYEVREKDNEMTQLNPAAYVDYFKKNYVRAEDYVPATTNTKHKFVSINQDNKINYGQRANAYATVGQPQEVKDLPKASTESQTVKGLPGKINNMNLSVTKVPGSEQSFGVSRPSVPVRDSSGNLISRQRNISNDKLMSGEEHDKNQGFLEKVVDKIYDVTRNWLPQKSKAFVKGAGETIANPIQRAAYEIKQTLGIESQTIDGRTPYSDGERLSLTAKYKKGTLTEEESKRLSYLNDTNDRMNRQYEGLRINGVEEDWEEVQTAEQLGSFAAEMIKLWLGGEIFGAIGAGVSAAANAGKVGKTIAGIISSTANFATAGATSAYGEGATSEQVAQRAVKEGVFGAVFGAVSNVVNAGGAKLLARKGISTDIIYGNQAARIGLNIGSNIVGMETGTFTSSKVSGEDATLSDYMSAAAMAVLFGAYGEFKTLRAKNPETGKTMFSTIKESRKIQTENIESLKKSSLDRTFKLFREYLYNPNESSYNELVKDAESNIEGIEKIILYNRSRMGKNDGSELLSAKNIKELTEIQQGYIKLQNETFKNGYRKVGLPSTEISGTSPTKPLPKTTPASTEVKTSTAPVSKNDVNSAIERIKNGTATNKDYDLFKTGNVQNRQMFESATGQTLPVTNSETRKFLRNYQQSNTADTSSNTEGDNTRFFNLDELAEDYADKDIPYNEYLKKRFQDTNTDTANSQNNHTPEQLKVMQEYENAVDDDLLSFIQRAKDNPKDNKTTFEIGDVSDRLAEDVNRLTGINIDDYTHAIKSNSITHIENGHGKNGTTDNSMADDNDIARMKYVIDNYDNIELLDDVSGEFRDKNQNPAPLIKMSKRIDGTYYVVEAVPDTKKHQLNVVSAYKNKAVEQQMGTAQGHDPNVRNASTDTAFDNNIPQSDNVVNMQNNASVTDINSGLNNENDNGIINKNGGIENGQRNDGTGTQQGWSDNQSTGEQGASLWRYNDVAERTATADVRRGMGERVQRKGKGGETVTYERITVDDNQKSRHHILLENQANRLGAKIEYGLDITIDTANGKTKRAFALVQGDTIVVSYDAPINSGVEELAHRIKTVAVEKYNALFNGIMNNIKNEAYTDLFLKANNEYGDLYNIDGNVNADAITEEIVCGVASVIKTGTEDISSYFDNYEEVVSAINKYFDSEISNTQVERANAKQISENSPKKFLSSISEFIPLPKTSTGKIKRNISAEVESRIADIRLDYMKTGQVNEEKASNIFEYLYESAVIENVGKYDDALDYIKNTKLYISPTDKSNITDFNKFRQSMFRKLNITTDSTKGGIPVDVAFMEFNEQFPGLVDKGLTHPADQLQALADFTDTAKEKQKVSIDEYFGTGAEEVRNQMQEMFDDGLKEYLDGGGQNIKFNVASSENEGAFIMRNDNNTSSYEMGNAGVRGDTTDISENDVKNVQSIGRKSVNDFTSYDIKKSETFAKKYFKEIGIKSPFFRAWFGDWRSMEKTIIPIIDIHETKQKNPRGQFLNNDTGFIINSSSVGYDETISHSGKDKLSVIAMQNIDKIIENAVLLDTEVSEYGRGKKSIYTCFMHKFYAPVYIEGKACIAKMAVDESYQPGATDTNKKFYHVRAIKIEPVSSVGIGFNHTPIMDKTDSNISISDLFKIVNNYDTEFNPKKVNSYLLNDDGTPKIVYHGTNNRKESETWNPKTKSYDTSYSKFTVFKKSYDEQIGHFFASEKDNAGGYGNEVYSVYLNIKKPLIIECNNADYSAIQYNGVIKDTYEWAKYAKKSWYDGVIFKNIRDGAGYEYMQNSIDEYVVFSSNQIKSATDNIGTFDRNNLDIRYSVDNSPEFQEVHNKYNKLLEKYGAIKKGENPKVDVKVPKKSSDNMLVSEHARTIAESGLMPDEMQGEFEKMVVDGNMSHQVIKDKDAQADAVKRIRERGFKEAVRDWEGMSENGRIDKKDIAYGQALFNTACAAKDVTLAKKIAVDLAMIETQSGQNLQAARMLKKMSPDGQLYYLEKTTKKINEELKEKFKDKAVEVEIDNDLAKELLNAENQKQINEAVEKIQQNIADQIPSTWIEKWNSWRYLSMLGNTRTHIRNIVGNAAFVPVRKIKNYIGAGLEKAILPKEERTKSFAKTDESKKYAADDWEEMKDVVMGNEGKYNNRSDIESKKQIFKLKFLEWARKTNMNALEAEDAFFLKGAYRDSFAQMMTARGYTAEFLNSGTKEANNALNELREHATQEAQEATYRDSSKVAEFLNDIQRKAMKGNTATKAAGLVMEGVLPFKKTPVNILKRGVEYSPVGLIKGITDCARNVKRGKISASDAINEISKGLTGTAVVALGALLARMGILSIDTDDDENLRAYKKMLGNQRYSLNFGDHSYTIDWLAPMSLPLFVGAETYNMVKDDHKNPVTAITDALSGISDPVFELSCLSGVKDAFESVKYSEGNAFTDATIDMLSSYLSQALPTLGGQIARTIDGTKRNAYYVDRNSSIPEALDSFIKQAALKIPGATFMLEPQIDAWGNEVKYEGNVVGRFVQNTISPGYWSSNKATATDEKLLELYNKTGEKSVIPQKANMSFKVNGEMKYLTGEEYTEFAKNQGKMSFEYVKSFTQSLNYAGLDDDIRASVIDDLYSFARYKAQEDICDDYEMPIEFQKVKAAESKGITAAQYLTARAVIKGIESDKDSNGETITYSKSDKQMSTISDKVNGLSEMEKREMFELMGYTEGQIKHFMGNNGTMPKAGNDYVYVGLPRN